MDTFYSHLILVNFPGIFWAGNIPKSKMKKRKNWDLTLVIQSETLNSCLLKVVILWPPIQRNILSEWKDTLKIIEIYSIFSPITPIT